MERKQGEHPLGDTGQLVALGVFLLLWGVDSFLLRRTTFLSAYVPLYVRVGVLIAAVGIAAALVRSGHAAVRHDEGPTGVLTAGAFAYVRHPLYLGSVLVYFGLAFSTFSLAAVGVAAAILAGYDYLAAYEERYLESRFGDEYRSYKVKTGKWLPKPRSR
jgi:protein-S-isoprenylcysteine O-methyltransferase Ste14